MSNFIKSKPILIQVAKDGVWENTWNIDLSKSVPEEVEIEQYLKRSVYKDVAVEVVFQEAPDVFYILGMTFNSHLKTRTANDFLQVFINEVINYSDFKDFVDHLDQRIVGQEFLLTGIPDLIRIGIVNHWFSVGPCLVWQKNWPKEMSRHKLEQRLETKPEVIETDLNYQGMSFIFNIEGKQPGLCHWIKSPCSKRDNGVWKLDRQLILDYLHSWQGFLTA